MQYAEGFLFSGVFNHLMYDLIHAYPVDLILPFDPLSFAEKQIAFLLSDSSLCKHYKAAFYRSSTAPWFLLIAWYEYLLSFTGNQHIMVNPLFQGLEVKFVEI